MTLQVIAECQKTGGTAAFIDAEHALDPASSKNRVNTEELLVSQPIVARMPSKLPICWGDLSY
ncbi:MAG: hypothetical protein Ct9H300mP4_03060 [Gammaproteobacteria bacterium]|nr:MAG: hypothetical protein Ct9H300mP4_03060 [Gammaproteobacteria bacterium]